VIRVGLTRTQPSYAGLTPPYHPGKCFPELDTLLGNAGSLGTQNHVYAAVRAALWGLGLDAERFGTSEWNPLGQLVGRGKRVVLKPNFIRHWNPEFLGSIESVITHGSILRAVADYAFLAVGSEGSVVVAEAPQHDCDFSEIRRIVGLNELATFYEETLGHPLEIIDLRREAVHYKNGVIDDRQSLPGDPLGYRSVDLGERSFFTNSGLNPARFRGADYDPGPTTVHHAEGRNQYLLSETVLSADLVVNLPKLKTHKKTGVTLALKNLVGINGDKNWLPHHSTGSVSEGGDEFPGRRLRDRLRSRATEIARPLLARGLGTRFFRFARKVESVARGDAFIRSGNWHGNRTTWRMCADLNRCLYYSDAAGLHLTAEQPVRTVLSIIDGIVAGEGNGPLAPQDVPLGVVIAATDPIAADLVAIRLMGFDEGKIPKVREVMRDSGPRITGVRWISDVRINEIQVESLQRHELGLDDLRADRIFEAHPGWQGHVEKTSE